MITDQYLIHEKPNPIGGVSRIYRFKSGMGLSLINAAIAHYYPFAWEAAVIKGVKDDGTFEGIDYSTELTEDVITFMSDEEANAFIEKAAKTI